MARLTRSQSGEGHTTYQSCDFNYKVWGDVREGCYFAHADSV